MWRTCSADLLPGESVVQHLVLQWLCCHRHNGLSIAQHHYTTSCVKRTLCFVEKFASYLVSAHLFKRPTMQSNACHPQCLDSCQSVVQLTAVFLSVSSSAILQLKWQWFKMWRCRHRRRVLHSASLTWSCKQGCQHALQYDRTRTCDLGLDVRALTAELRILIN